MMIDQTCTFCENPASILEKNTCCTGCSKLPKLCDGNSEIIYKIDWNKKQKIECIVTCNKCEDKISMILSNKIRFCCDDPILNESKMILSDRWKRTHSKEMLEGTIYND